MLLSRFNLLLKLLVVNGLALFFGLLFFKTTPFVTSINSNRVEKITKDDAKTTLRKQVEMALYQQIHQRESNRLTAMCWAPDTSPETVASFHKKSANQHVESFHSLSTNLPEDYNTSLIWSRTATDGFRGGTIPEVIGKPLTLTWSFVPDGTTIPGYNPSLGEVAAPSNLIAFLDGIYNCTGGSDLTTRCWFYLFEDIFARWEELTGFTYVYEPNDDGQAWTIFGVPAGALGVRGDLRIAGHRIDGDRNVLAYNFFPNTSDMVIDTDDNFYNDTTNNSLKLRNVLSHEHGHGLGLSHSCPVDNKRLMQPFISLDFDGPQEDDILGANFGYGDRFGCNDNVAQATDLGSLNMNGQVIQQVSLDAYDIFNVLEEDFYQIKLEEEGSINITVTPTGTQYLAGTQNIFTGACNPGVPFDALTEGDLNIQLIDSDGLTVLGTANQHAAGIAETLSFGPFLNISAGKTLYIRVFGAAGNQTQMYNLQLALTPPPIPSLSQWGLFIFSLLIINLGVFFIHRQSIYLSRN